MLGPCTTERSMPVRTVCLVLIFVGRGGYTYLRFSIPGRPDGTYINIPATQEIFLLTFCPEFPLQSLQKKVQNPQGNIIRPNPPAGQRVMSKQLPDGLLSFRRRCIENMHSRRRGPVRARFPSPPRGERGGVGERVGGRGAVAG